jgi:hypothetical protein
MAELVFLLEKRTSFQLCAMKNLGRTQRYPEYAGRYAKTDIHEQNPN